MPAYTVIEPLIADEHARTEWYGAVKVGAQWLHPEMPLVSAARIMGRPTFGLFNDPGMAARPALQARARIMRPYVPQRFAQN